MSWIINLIKKIFGMKEEATDWKLPSDDSYSSNEIEETVNFNKMNKKELEKYGRTLGIELDRRWSRSRLIDRISAAYEASKVKPVKHRHIKSKKKRMRAG